MTDRADDFDRGLVNRRAVLGDAWVDKSLSGASGFNADFQTLIYCGVPAANTAFKITGELLRAAGLRFAQNDGFHRARQTTMSKAFASQADLAEKKVTFTRLSDNAYAYTAEGDPNSGVVIGDDAVMVIDTQATPVMAADVIRRIREITDLPVKYVVMSHYHAVRVLGASAYGASEIIASEDTRDLIVERGAADMKSEIERFPRLFQAVETIPGLTWPTLTFRGEMTLWLGKVEVKLMQLGRGHTKGDTVAWLPKEKILFSGDLVEYGATAYAGDAYFNDWPVTLDKVEALGATAIVPGRGAALTNPAMCREGIATTRAFISELFASVKAGVAKGHELKQVFADTDAVLRPKYGQQFIYEHCMPFDVSRAYDEATSHRDPRIWTAERDKAMWAALG